jgi:hypothetical protein
MTAGWSFTSRQTPFLKNLLKSTTFPPSGTGKKEQAENG